MKNMDINSLVASIEVELEAAETREAKATRAAQIILAGTQQEGREALTPEEEGELERLDEVVELAQAQQESIKRKLARARRVAAQEADMDERMASASVPENLPDPKKTRTASISVGREEHTYSEKTDPTGKMFLNDIVRQFTTNDVRAADRLGRHMREEQVDRESQGMQMRASDVGTGAFSGLVVPQYLVDMVAPKVANLRPFADVCNKHPLPDSGMSLNISRITTASAVSLQSAELAAGGSTPMDDTLLSINVQTALGEQTVSRQAIERGTGIEDVVMQDLFRQYATSLDSNLITQATTGLQNVAASNTLSTMDLTNWFPAVLGAMSKSETNTLGMAHPTHLLLHPRRWYWLQSLLTSTWPAIAASNVDPRTTGKDSGAAYNAGGAGVFPGGLSVVMDANVPTNVGGTQDVAFVVPDVECHLWEEGGNPAYIRAEQPRANNLGVLLVVYGYYAYTFQRYASATQMLTGTGLAAPTGF
jgi:hypothetical protein